VFVGFEPLPRPPVDRPTDAIAHAIARLAAASTVRVAAQVCGFTASGSGVVVADRYVVTNAHVVAGARDGSVRVTSGSGDLVDARVVLFDSSLDVALLYARELRAAPLRFAGADPDRGTGGAALGYPGGGPLTIVSAAVTGSYVAIGRDIYGEARVERDILELRAQIDRGDSGGPFVLRDGTIGGLVFAEARTDPDVGYALSPTSVAVRIRPAVGRTAAVATGSCLR
jgi:S1-C subfamily serine protease